MPCPTFIISPDQQFLADHPHLAEQSRRLAQAYQAKTTVIEDAALEAIGSSLWQALDCEADFKQQ